MEGGARLFATSRGIFLQIGADFDIRTAKTDALVSLMIPPGRGGLLNRGGDVRVDWILGRNASISAGVTLPLGQRWKGKTRPDEPVKRQSAAQVEKPRKAPPSTGAEPKEYRQQEASREKSATAREKSAAPAQKSASPKKKSPPGTGKSGVQGVKH